MIETTSLLRLMSWLSPVFPTGGFAYSSGLEAAVQYGLVCDERALQDWLESSLVHGALRNDAILFAAAWRNWSNDEKRQELAELGLALAGSSERYLETTAQADAFSAAVKNWPENANLNLPDPAPFCVLVGLAAGANKFKLEQALSAYLLSAITNQVQAGIRLSVTGQTGAARILASLENVIAKTVEEAHHSDVTDLGSATAAAEIMAMKHEHMAGRMFRS